jgi:hypothetical protein
MRGFLTQLQPNPIQQYSNLAMSLALYSSPSLPRTERKQPLWKKNTVSDKAIHFAWMNTKTSHLLTVIHLTHRKINAHTAGTVNSCLLPLYAELDNHSEVRCQSCAQTGGNVVVSMWSGLQITQSSSNQHQVAANWNSTKCRRLWLNRQPRDTFRRDREVNSWRLYIFTSTYAESLIRQACLTLAINQTGRQSNRRCTCAARRILKWRH